MALQQEFTIEALTHDNLEEANKVRLQSWLETYANDELGITKEWIKERQKLQNSPKEQKQREAELNNPNFYGWVAKDLAGKIVGMGVLNTNENGAQTLGSLYVDSQWQGKGIGSAIMQRIIKSADASQDIRLDVAVYNERAIAFYQKWGFRVVPNSEQLFGERIPVIAMVKEGENNEI